MYEIIADDLKQKIIDGEFVPGEDLPSIQELTELYDVGRSTIREALNTLKLLGLIEMRQGEKSKVKEVDPEKVKLPDFQYALLTEQAILELTEARLLLEKAVVEKLALKEDRSFTKKIEETVRQMQENKDDKDKNVVLDMKFHKLLVEATENTIFIRMLKMISDTMAIAMEKIRENTFSNSELAEKIILEHTLILEAVKNGEPHKARELMDLHLQHFLEEIDAYIKTIKK